MADRHIIRIIRTTTQALKGVEMTGVPEPVILDAAEAEYASPEEAEVAFEELKDVLWGLEDVPF